MNRYLNIGGNSNVIGYEIGYYFIDIMFPGKTYRYSYLSAGVNNVETMKELARAGYGLNSFIMKNCRYSYEK